MKGNMVVTVGTGKLGSMVGYRITNSNDKEKQGLRAYVAHPSNPQSYLQAQQRVKIANIARTYGALKSVIRRSFEGKKYGGMSYLEFLKINLNAVPTTGPWVQKSHKSFVPGGYVMSQGSLTPVVTTYAQGMGFKVSLKGVNMNSLTTDGAFATAIVNANPQLQAGDQLTFVVVTEDENNNFTAFVHSILLDEEATTTNLLANKSKDDIEFDDAIITFGDGEDIMITDGALDPIVAAYVVVSRDGENLHLRSNATMAISTSLTTNVEYFGAEAKFAAIQSFMAAGSETDWPTEAIV